MMASIYWSMKESDWPADLNTAMALPEKDGMREWFVRYVGVADCIKLKV